MLLAGLKQRGFENVEGLDPSTKSIKMLEMKSIRGEHRNLFDTVLSRLKHQFELVCFTAVLEHIYDLNVCIQQLKTYLKEDGMLYIEAPDVRGFENTRKPIPHYFNQEHINYFSRSSLNNLLAQHGLLKNMKAGRR